MRSPTRALASVVRSVAARSTWLGATLGAALLAASSTAAAGPTSTFTVDDYAAWDAGEAKDAFITSLGEVKPGWTTTEVGLDEVGEVWAAVRGKGGEIFLGSGKGGSVWRMKGSSPQKLATLTGAIGAVSLALGPDGTLYAGSMPGGAVWRIEPGSGKAQKLATLDGAETVWSLAVSPDGKSVWAGTGPKGKLWRIEAKGGKARMVFDSEDKRIMSMLAAADGSIWFGTSDRALLFRHDPTKGTTRAVADFAGNELGALAEHRGLIYAAANDLKEPTTTGAKSAAAIEDAESKPDKGQKPKTPEKGSAPGAEAATPSGAAPTRAGERKGKGVLYRVRGDGQLAQIHALAATYYTALAVGPDGEVFAGAGDKGRIYMIEDDAGVSTAFDVEQRQIAAILADPAGRVDLAFITGDASKLYRAGPRAGTSTYTSKVFDSGAAARYGTLVWHGAGKLALETRSGNTEEPGGGWGAWEAARSVARAPGGGNRGKIGSPAGRYLQFRARLTSGDASLDRTELYYLPHNRPTRVTEVTVSPAAAAARKTLETGTADPRSPVVKLKWKVENEDGDETLYKLAVRREGEVRWRPLPTGGKPLTAAAWDWNAETYPDGEYRLRVTATDGRSNGSERALETTLVSELFVIDNQKPRVEDVRVVYPSASGRAVDGLSVIAEAAFSIDDGPWQLGSTQDGLFDDTTEMLRMTLPDDLPAGAHTLAIRVADESGNIGSTSLTFVVR
jgi:hypothetical protein